MKVVGISRTFPYSKLGISEREREREREGERGKQRKYTKKIYHNTYYIGLKHT